MRALFAIGILLCASSAWAAEAKWPTAIVFESGGTINPQIKTSVDLTTGALSQVIYSAEKRNGTTEFMPERTTSRSLTPNQLNILRRLVDNVWNKGIKETIVAPPCKSCATGEPGHLTVEVTATAVHECSIDSTGHFEIVKAGVVKTYDFLGSCIDPDGAKLVNELDCDAAPDPHACKTP